MKQSQTVYLTKEQVRRIESLYGPDAPYAALKDLIERGLSTHAAPAPPSTRSAPVRSPIPQRTSTRPVPTEEEEELEEFVPAADLRRKLRLSDDGMERLCDQLGILLRKEVPMEDARRIEDAARALKEA